MSRRFVSAAGAALLGTLAGLVLLAGFYVLSSTVRIDFDVDPPRLVSGMYPAERDAAGGLTFAWTGREVAFRLPGLDRRVPWSMDLRLRGGRQNAAENPVVAVFVDGVRVLERRSETGFTVLQVSIPMRPERPRGLLVTLQISRTFVPGPNDPRQLGVAVDYATLTADAMPLPPRGAFSGAAAGGGAIGAAMALLGTTPGLAVLGTLFVVSGESAVIARGFAPFTDFPQTASRIAIVISAALVILVFTIERVRREPFRNTARFAAAFTAAALFLKLLVLLHPDMPIGDALFQAHRFQEVLRGNYYFTSVAPGNYHFPYAPGLYVAAAPFADLVRREAGDVVLLRTVVAVTDAVAAALLYPVVARWWRDRRAAAFACALYQLLPLTFLIATGGTLTNAFAQSMAVIAFAAIAAPWARTDRLGGLAVLTMAMLAAFLSHTSTFAILSVSGIVVSLMLFWRGGREMRTAALAVGVSTVAAVVIAVIVYYAHFLDTYRTELSRIGGETAAAAADAGGRTITDRALIVPLYLYVYFGVPALILAAAGGVELWRRSGRDRMTLTVAGWAIACALFLLVGVLTPVDMRYYVAALPAVAIAGAAGASAWWSAGGARRILAVLLLAGTVIVGVQTWWGILG
ncbi:MAG: hypothetical protein ACRD1U_14105 [Vicinamibacterales bacterium]